MALVDYISNNFAQLKAQLNWLDSTSIVAIVAKAAELYGAADESGMTDSKKAHALTDVAVWRQARADVALDYSFAADNASYSRGQMSDHIDKALAAAESNAVVYMPAYGITVHEDTSNADWQA